MADIIFKLISGPNTNGSISGELKIPASKSWRTIWPTIERGAGYTFVRKGEYTLRMDIKHTGRNVKCFGSIMVASVLISFMTH